jgi:hypothetical protein
MSILAKIINSYTAPRKVFEAVKDFDWKKAFIPLLVLGILGLISYWAIQDLANDYGYEKAVNVIENMDRLTDEQKVEQIAKIEERMDGPQITSWISSALGGPITVFFMTLITLLVGNTFMGGSAKYGQLLNITAWAYMVNILENILEVYTGLGVLGIGEKGSFINSLLAGIDIFAIWRIVLIAIGMGIIYNKKTKPYLIAMSIAWVVLRIIGAGFSSFFVGLAG